MVKTKSIDEKLKELRRKYPSSLNKNNLKIQAINIMGGRYDPKSNLGIDDQLFICTQLLEDYKKTLTI